MHEILNHLLQASILGAQSRSEDPVKAAKEAAAAFAAGVTAFERAISESKGPHATA